MVCHCFNLPGSWLSDRLQFWFYALLTLWPGKTVVPARWREGLRKGCFQPLSAGYTRLPTPPSANHPYNMWHLSEDTRVNHKRNIRKASIFLIFRLKIHVSRKCNIFFPHPNGSSYILHFGDRSSIEMCPQERFIEVPQLVTALHHISTLATQCASKGRENGPKSKPVSGSCLMQHDHGVSLGGKVSVL